jgi:hypothetical protein
MVLGYIARLLIIDMVLGYIARLSPRGDGGVLYFTCSNDFYLPSRRPEKGGKSQHHVILPWPENNFRGRARNKWTVS